MVKVTVTYEIDETEYEGAPEDPGDLAMWACEVVEEIQRGEADGPDTFVVECRTEGIGPVFVTAVKAC